MELIASITNFQKHLYFENNPSSREYALDRCMKVLAMIAKIKDRNQLISDMYDNLLSDSIKTIEYKKFKNNLEMIKRLEGYYNYCLSRVFKFSID